MNKNLFPNFNQVLYTQSQTGALFVLVFFFFGPDVHQSGFPMEFKIFNDNTMYNLYINYVLIND